MPNVLKLIEEEEEFLVLVASLRDMTFAPLDYFFKTKNEVDATRANLAYQKYKYEIDRFSEYLHSKNPDHYKRCGALLYALCSNPVITNQDIEVDRDEILSGFTQITTSDAPHVVDSIDFYNEYFKEFAAFDLCYRICCAYEDEKKTLTFDVIHNICHYLKQNNLCINSYFMLFRTLMA